MLYMLGPVIFEIWPLNATAFERDGSADHVDKPILNRRPPLEFVGDGPETIRISAKLFPEKLGGLGSIDDLRAMRASGKPQYLMRGDGVPMGWMAVERISEKHSYLGANGVGRVIEVDIGLKRSDAPNAADFFSSIVGLLP